jgi:hypothetical protein
MEMELKFIKIPSLFDKCVISISQHNRKAKRKNKLKVNNKTLNATCLNAVRLHSTFLHYKTWNSMFLRESKNGNLKNIKYALDNGVTFSLYKVYGLRYASRSGNFELVKFLHNYELHTCDNPIRWDGCDECVCIARHSIYDIIYVAIGGCLEGVMYLMEKYRDSMDVKIITFAKQCASKYKHLEIVKYLDENGADETIKKTFEYEVLVQKFWWTIQELI